MTQPKHGPFKLHFIAGVVTERDVKSYHKRKYGWLPNGSRSGNTKRMKKRK